MIFYSYVIIHLSRVDITFESSVNVKVRRNNKLNNLQKITMFTFHSVYPAATHGGTYISTIFRFLPANERSRVLRDLRCACSMTATSKNQAIVFECWINIFHGTHFVSIPHHHFSNAQLETWYRFVRKVFVTHSKERLPN